MEICGWDKCAIAKSCPQILHSHFFSHFLFDCHAGQTNWKMNDCLSTGTQFLKLSNCCKNIPIFKISMTPKVAIFLTKKTSVGKLCGFFIIDKIMWQGYAKGLLRTTSAVLSSTSFLWWASSLNLSSNSLILLCNKHQGDYNLPHNITCTGSYSF